jgi:glycosyltransferase involved in cell wall biosynthesis
VLIRLALDARKLTDYGIGTYLSHLVSGLAVQPDLQLTLLVNAGHEERASAIAPTARILGVSAGEYTLSEHLKLPLALWREPIDLIHFPHYVVPRVLPKPVVVTVHDVIQLFYPPAHRWQLALVYLRLMLRSSLRRARRVITVSRSSRRDLINLFAADPRRLVVVPNGVEERLGARPDRDDIETIKQYYGLRPPLVVVVANDKPHKNLDMVLRAYAVAVRRQQVPGQLVFVGGLGPDNRLERRAEQLGLADRVRSLGRVPAKHLHTLYHLGAVLLHVALYEGFGLPVLEAMRAQLPVITSNLGAMREVGEGAARLVNPLDVSEIAEALTQVLVDDALRRRMVEAGQRRARHLTWERTVEGTLAVYRQALEV